MVNGLGSSLSDLSILSNAKTRSVSPENFTGEKGKGGMATDGCGASAARDLGLGWKVSPCVSIPAGTTFTRADISGEGAIKHIWVTDSSVLPRSLILRIYWDGSDIPSVEVPLCDFFACADYLDYRQLSSLAVCVNPRRGFNCYWEMPFKKGFRFTLENLDKRDVNVFYQIDYILTQLPPDTAYFHAQFRRTNPLPYKEVYTILDGIKGKGTYVGTYLYWGVNNNNWWGEGEIKFYMDGDQDFPTICGTGTEDYFCGAYNFDVPGQGYTAFSTAYSGLPQVIRPDGLYRSNTRFGMYRWHITDPIRFEQDLRVTIQDLGWRSERRYLVQQSDIASVAYWYQTLPTRRFAPLGDRNELEII